MGGGGRYPYPKWVWTPTGGWWAEGPPTRNRNLFLAIGFGLVSMAMVFKLSASKERRLHPNPVIPIPSQRWSKWTAVDDPNYEEKYRAYHKNKKPLYERILPDSLLESTSENH